MAKLEYQIIETDETTGTAIVNFVNPWKHKDGILNDPFSDVQKVVSLPFKNGKVDNEKLETILEEQAQGVFARMKTAVDRYGEHVYKEEAPVKAPARKKR